MIALIVLAGFLASLVIFGAFMWNGVHQPYRADEKLDRRPTLHGIEGGRQRTLSERRARRRSA
jgi:hypothetical protein